MRFVNHSFGDGPGGMWKANTLRMLNVNEFLVVYKGYEDNIGDTEWRPESELELTCKEILDRKRSDLMEESKTSSGVKRKKRPSLPQRRQPKRRLRSSVSLD